LQSVAKTVGDSEFGAAGVVRHLETWELGARPAGADGEPSSPVRRWRAMAALGGRDLEAWSEHLAGRGVLTLKCPPRAPSALDRALEEGRETTSAVGY